MRLIIQTSEDTITLDDHPIDRRDFWCIKKDGVTGLYGTPAVRENPTDRPQASGSYWPSRLTQKPRSISIDGYVLKPSSLSAALARDRINNLMGRELTIIEITPLGRRVMTGYLSADPEPTMRLRAHRAFEFGLVITCPDPLKYGVEQTFDVKDGVCTVRNDGNAPTWPIITLSGPCTTLSVEVRADGVQAAGKIVWSGSGPDGMELDLRDMVPTVGRITMDNAVPIMPGRHVLDVTADNTVMMHLRSAWR